MTVFLDRCTHTVQLKLKFVSSFIPQSSSCFVRTLSEFLSDLSIYLTFLLFISLIFLLSPSTSLMPWITNPRTSAEELGTLAKKNSSTGYEPNDHFITEACVEFTQESVTEQRFPEDFDYDDITISQTLLDACRRRADHSDEKACRLVCRRRQRTGKTVVCRDIRHEQGQEIQRQNSESEQIRTLLERLEECFADCQAEIRKHEFQADCDRIRIRKLNETIKSQQEELHRAQAEELNRRDQQLLHAQLLDQHWDLHEAHDKSLKEMEELKKFQSSTFDTIARRKLVEDQDTILELIGKIQELQNELNCMNDSRDFQDAESVRSGHSHVTSQPVSFPPHPIFWWNAEPFYRNAEPQRWAAKHLGHTWYIGKRFCRFSSVFFSTLSAGVESMEFSYIRTTSVIFSGGDSSKNYGADQQRLQISDLHFDKFTTPATFACWKIRFKTEVCTCSQFPTEAMHWIKEVEMVDSVDDLKIFVICERNSNARF